MKRAIAMVIGAAALHGAATAAPVEGTLILNGKPIRVTHVAAQLHDNAEGVFNRPLTIVFADRPVPPGLLDGGNAIAVHQLARAGDLRGLMFRMDPKKPDEASLILLDKPADALTGLVSLSVASADKPVIVGLRLTADKVAGSIDRPEGGPPQASVGYALRFDSVLAREPAPTADLQGAPLKASAQYKVATAYAEAVAKGDLAAVRRASGRLLREQMDAMVAAQGGPAVAAQMIKGAAREKAQLQKIKRLVERGSRAMLLVDAHEYLTMVKEDGEWKMGS